MKIPIYNENKILYTNEILKWMEVISSDKNNVLITPMTKIDELINFKSKGILKKMIVDYINELNREIINTENISILCKYINRIFNSEIIEMDVSIDKIIKTFLDIDSNIKIDEKFIKKYLSLLNEHATKQTNVYISGYDIKAGNYSMLNIFILTSSIGGKISWENLESLVLLSDDPIEIMDRDKFVSWLELKTRTVLTIKDLNNYFSGNISMNSFLIDRALKNI